MKKVTEFALSEQKQ